MSWVCSYLWWGEVGGRMSTARCKDAVMPESCVDDHHPTRQQHPVDVWCQSKSFWMNHLTRQKWEDEKPKMTKSLHRLAGWAALSPLTSLLETSRVNLLDPIFWTAQLTGDKSKEPWISFIPAHAFSTFSTWPSHLYILVIQLNLLIQCPPYLSMGLRRFNT